MKRLLSLAAVLALVAARPELYKENEEFQYSRSSTDEGSKAGFYGAQRGNMGGNYERAHNMDQLAQHQMSGAVNQVEGELGDASNTKSGSVFTSANSRGMYGSGKHDLSNLQGRNFQEGIHDDSSLTHSSLSSHNLGYNSHAASLMHNVDYNSHSQSSRYQGAKSYGQKLQADNLQASEGVGVYDYGRGAATSSHESGMYAQSGYHSESGYASKNVNQHSSTAYTAHPQSRLVLASPVKVVVRPGTRVTVPLGVQTYDATHSASTLDQNAINADTEVFNTDNKQVNYMPTSNSKRYESSYSYRKQWEKHDTKPEVVPLSIPTENPIPKNSELYDDSLSSLHSSSNKYHSNILNAESAAHTSNVHSGYNKNVKTSSAASSGYHSGLSNAYTDGAYTGNTADTTNGLGEIDTKPKSYQSSYSYHKSWERQGDPYVIKPVSGAYTGDASQRLTTVSGNHGYASSHQYGSQFHKAHQSYTQGGILEDCNCDDTGHVRVARSQNSLPSQYDTYNQQPQSGWADPERPQQTPSKWDDIEDQGQQTQYLGQQTQKNGTTWRTWGNGPRISGTIWMK